MKSYSVTRTAVGAGLVASLMLMQGCSYFGGDKKPDDPPPVIPDPGTTTVITDPPVEIKPVAATTSYTIAKGDTISEVALRYGLRWQDVLAVNPGVSPKKLRVGQVIQLPGQVDLSKSVPVRKPTTPKFTAPKTSAPKSVKGPTGPGTAYVVKSGDTLGGIAYRHGVKADAIRKANNMTSDKISINQKLTIPGATKKPAGDAKVSEKKDPVAVELPKVTPPDVPPVAPVTPPPVDTNATVAPVDATTTSVVTPPVTPAANAQTYTVKEGEDLYAVAIRWGVSPSDLKALNNLTSTDLKAGMVLQIPASAQ